jgi:hypothetical protein
MWDVFISHASEDKDSVARPLAIALQTHGLTTWLDAEAMFAHEPLDQRIVDGLRNSQIIVLILSSRFLSKEWTTREMMLALELEAPPRCVVVPLLHNLDDDDIDQVPPILRNRPGVSTRESLETAIVRIVATIRSVRRESPTGWIHFLPDGWPTRHMFEDWLSEADRRGYQTIEAPLIAWPSELFACINQTERFAEKLTLATPDPDRPEWFDSRGMKLRGMDIQACRSAPLRARAMMELCPVRIACLAAGLKTTGGCYWYATYSGRTFLYLALKEIFRTINEGALIAGCPLPATTRLDDISAMPKVRLGGGRLGSVLVTSDPVAAAIKPHLSGGNELSVTGKVDHLEYLLSNTDGAPWMDFFEDYLIPQVELGLLMFGVRSTIVHSCNSTSWRFRRFRDENGNEI